jgi:hypothetical protein
MAPAVATGQLYPQSRPFQRLPLPTSGTALTAAGGAPRRAAGVHAYNNFTMVAVFHVTWAFCLSMAHIAEHPLLKEMLTRQQRVAVIAQRLKNWEWMQMGGANWCGRW